MCVCECVWVGGVMGMDDGLRALHMLGKCSTTELYASPRSLFLRTLRDISPSVPHV
jgi:hypothetical protein